LLVISAAPNLRGSRNNDWQCRQCNGPVVPPEDLLHGDEHGIMHLPPLPFQKSSTWQSAFAEMNKTVSMRCEGSRRELRGPAAESSRRAGRAID